MTPHHSLVFTTVMEVCSIDSTAVTSHYCVLYTKYVMHLLVSGRHDQDRVQFSSSLVFRFLIPSLGLELFYFLRIC